VDALLAFRLPGLHDKFGKPSRGYVRYERRPRGEIKLFRRIRRSPCAQDALDALRDGHPWITFKDPCNIRSRSNTWRGAFVESLH